MLIINVEDENKCGILTFMNRINFKLIRVEHRKREGRIKNFWRGGSDLQGGFVLVLQPTFFLSKSLWKLNNFILKGGSSDPPEPPLDSPLKGFLMSKIHQSRLLFLLQMNVLIDDK